MAWEKGNVCAAPDCWEPCRRKWCSELCRRRTMYGGTCKYCGAKTDGSNGAAKAPEVCRSCQGHERKEWTREAILAALRLWVERFGEAPTVTDWSEAHARKCSLQTQEKKRRRRETGRWPGPTLVAAEFGSWKGMLELAELPLPRMAMRGTWTRETVVESMRAWAAEHGRPPRATDWTHAEQGAHPSSKTVYDLFGSWPAGLAAAGFSPSPPAPRPSPPRRRSRPDRSSLPRRSPRKELEEPVMNTPAANRARVASMRN
jgi:hypothetical protein